MDFSIDWSFFIVTSTGIERGVGMGWAMAAAEGDGARLVCYGSGGKTRSESSMA